MRHQRLLILLALLATGANAQWLNFHVPGTPRLKDGSPNLMAPAPRVANGKPDLSGVWMHEYTTHAEMQRLFGDAADAEDKVSVPGMERDTISKYGLDIMADFRPNDAAMMRPAAKEAIERGRANRNPANVCNGAAGIPLAGLLSEPFRITQSPKMTVILYESDDTHRQIYTDGRGLPKEISFPAYLGYSVGKWEKDTLVVETAGFNEKTMLDAGRHPHSEDLHITERYRRPDFGHMEVETTFDDPKMYTKPFTVKINYTLLADQDIFESFCTENEKDREHLEKK